MAQITEIRVFISSPGDVARERDALERVILQDLNPKLEPFDVRLKPLRWEKDGRPALGNPQKNLFAQMGEYDFFVGIFWKRFGTPDGMTESGSETEFRDAYNRWQEDNSRPVMMYFCERKFEVDLDIEKGKLIELKEQAEKVEAFQSEVGGLGLYWTFTEVEEFEQLTSRHLFKAVFDKIITPETVRSRLPRAGPNTRPAG